MRLIEKVLFTTLLAIVGLSFIFGEQVTKPLVSAVFCSAMIGILVNRFIINIRDEK